MRQLRSAAATLLCIQLITCGRFADAIVVRHDVSDSKYRVAPNIFPPLVALPGEGQGTLISPDWVISAAHVVTGRQIHEISICGKPRQVSEVIIHPDYRPAPESLQSGAAQPLMDFMNQSADVALIRLTKPVRDVKPVILYRATDEAEKIAEILGRGATGNGLVGEYKNSPHAGHLRRAYSRVISAEGRWLKLRFDQPPKTLPLEGMPADGDSGGPILIRVGDSLELAGLVSHKFASGPVKDFKCCSYGQVTYQSRISYYLPWIASKTGIPASMAK